MQQTQTQLPVLTLMRCEVDSDSTVLEFSCDFNVVTAGDGLWGCEAGRVVNVTNIVFVTNAMDGEVYTHISVGHNSTWDIYTDTGFETAISEALRCEVTFTEQGMQEDECASMET